MTKNILFFLLILLSIIKAQDVNAIYPQLEKLCKDLHANPELSLKEEKTSERIALELRKLGYDVTERFAGYGLVGVLKNGEGKTVLIRTDLDALPIDEQTGLKFTSNNKGVMHACGHDMHMSVFIGTAKLLADNKDKWKGTALLIGQPAEEVGKGARMMLEAGLYKVFGVPNYALAIHVTPSFKAGTIGYYKGNAMSSATSITIKVKGIGGHGASPHLSIDPIVVSSQMILAFQTIVSREVSPFDPAVVTVGYIKGGTKHNIIPNEVEMGLTVRSFNDIVKEKILNSIRTKAKSIAQSAGLPDNLLPEVIISEETPSVYNYPNLVDSLLPLLKKELGEQNVIEAQQWSASEDFSEYGRTKDKVASFLIWVGTALEEDWKKKEQGFSIPFVHSPNFNPDFENTIKTGVRTVISAALYLLGK